jgi:putative salt-induced outer membrane protein YdiY
MSPRALLLATLLPTLALAQEPSPAGPAEKLVIWKGTLGAGLILTTGNSESATFNGGLAGSRESAHWIASLKADGTFGRSRAAAGGAMETSAWKGGGQVRLDLKLDTTWTVYGLAGISFDHVAAIEYRTAAELGASALWLNQKEADWTRLSLRTDLGFRYGYEARRAYYGPIPGALQGVEVLAPRLGLAFRYGFTKDALFTEEAELLSTLGDQGRWLARSVSKLSTRLVGAIALGAAYTVTWDSDPVPGKKGTDTTLAVLVEFGF